MTSHRVLGLVICGILIAHGASGQEPAKRRLTLDDLYRVRDVSGPEISPDGNWVAYTVTVPDTV